MNRIFKHSLAPRTSYLAPLRGFTLNEVLMTVVIVGILAAIAIPSYRKTIERGYWRTAQDLLMAVYNGEWSYYYTHNNVYYDVDEAGGMTEWRKIYVDNPNLAPTIPVTFTVVTPTPETFTAMATYNDGRTIQINQNREWCGRTTCCGGCAWNP